LIAVPTRGVGLAGCNDRGGTVVSGSSLTPIWWTSYALTSVPQTQRLRNLQIRPATATASDPT